MLQEIILWKASLELTQICLAGTFIRFTYVPAQLKGVDRCSRAGELQVPAFCCCSRHGWYLVQWKGLTGWLSDLIFFKFLKYEYLRPYHYLFIIYYHSSLNNDPKPYCWCCHLETCRQILLKTQWKTSGKSLADAVKCHVAFAVVKDVNHS